MKSLPFLFIFMFLLSPITSFAQDFDSEEMDSEIEEQQYVETSEISPMEEAPGEIESQEDVIFPDGETNDWSLGGEDLAAEDYQ